MPLHGSTQERGDAAAARCGHQDKAAASDRSGLPELARKASIESIGLFLRLRDQIVFVVACAIALVSMTAYVVRTSNWGKAPIELERQPAQQLDYRIELNSASWMEWSQIPGIGPVLAERIVQERERNGPFRNSDDLMRVRGVGAKKLQQIRPYLQVEAPEQVPPVQGERTELP